MKKKRSESEIIMKYNGESVIMKASAAISENEGRKIIESIESESGVMLKAYQSSRLQSNSEHQ